MPDTKADSPLVTRFQRVVTALDSVLIDRHERARILAAAAILLEVDTEVSVILDRQLVIVPSTTKMGG